MWQEIGFEKTVIFEVLGKQKKLHSFLEGTQESSEYKGPYGGVYVAVFIEEVTINRRWIVVNS